MGTGISWTWRNGRARKRLLAGAVALAVTIFYAAISLFGSPPAAAALVPGSPSCAELGYGFGFRIDQPVTRLYHFTDADGTLTGGAPSDPDRAIAVAVNNSVSFSWSSGLAIDAVIVAGGADSNLYAYGVERFGDAGLTAPVNPTTGQPFPIESVEVCYDYELNVQKTAVPTFSRTWNWNISKSVTPSTWELFNGDSGTSSYTVGVERTGFTDSGWAVSGTIVMTNSTPLDATVTGVSDQISGGIPALVDCGVSYPHTLPAGQTLLCNYSAALPDTAQRTNTATVATIGAVGGGSAARIFQFAGPTTVVNGSITVEDTNGLTWTFDDSGSVGYDDAYTCNSDAGVHPNAATIAETGQSASAAVAVTCHDLAVTKSAGTSFDRTWNWTIDKSADAENLTVSSGELWEVDYAIDIDAFPVDSNHAVSGVIRIQNPHPARAAQLTGVEDVISAGISATVDCPALVIAPGESIECSYSAALPDGASRINTATAVQQNFAFGSDGSATPAGTTGYSGSADVIFGSPANEIDECVDVQDTLFGPAGVYCASEAPASIVYPLLFGDGPAADVQMVCGLNSIANTASFGATDSGATGEDSWTVNATLGCDNVIQVCTLTQGYWKTHSEHGPAPYDDAWAQLPAGADTSFFLSGQSYHDVLWTPPKGNAYLILSSQYIAATLNFLNGAAAPPEVLDVWNEATGLFETYTPGEIAALKSKNGGKDLRVHFTDLAGILGDYNEGRIGPGHCDDAVN